jgi:hypothetical protein
MVYVPGYQHDIFVSYAHVDDVPFSGADKGWVTTFISNLKNELGRQLGRTDAYSLWMDYELRGNQPVTPDIDKQLNNTAILLLILSRGYQASSWCQLEMNTFLSLVGDDSGRLFVVEHDLIPYQDKRPELQDLLNYPFWIQDNHTGRTRTLAIPKPNPDREPEYYQRLNDLARDITDKLNELKKKAQPPDVGNGQKEYLEVEKARLETEIAGKQKQQQSLLSSLRNPRIPTATRQRLKDQFDQLAKEVEQLTAEIQDIDRQLVQLKESF